MLSIFSCTYFPSAYFFCFFWSSVQIFNLYKKFVVCFLIVEFLEFVTYSGYKSFIRYMFYKEFLQVCDLLFYSQQYLSYIKKFNLIKYSLSIKKKWIVLLVPFLKTFSRFIKVFSVFFLFFIFTVFNLKQF